VEKENSMPTTNEHRKGARKQKEYGPREERQGESG